VARRLVRHPLPFTVAGAVLAETFVAMPFFVLTMEGALRSVDRRSRRRAARSGASRWPCSAA
jgi:molybdate transport system permease protein